MFPLAATPYELDPGPAQQVQVRLHELEARVTALRGAGTLTAATVRDYYGEKRFEHVAESNALEGSTLSVGETELAVLQGITISGHDPGYIRDAIALDKALTRVVELAQQATPTNLQQLFEIHELLLGDRRPGAGSFRTGPVIIRGSKHRPPKTLEKVYSQMKEWERWSVENHGLPAPLRSVVLHAWLTHVHPFIDGNGRTARAIGNLELIRAGYPSIIIKKQARGRYLEGLGESDEGGDLRSFLELVFDRVDAALTGLEQSALKQQGFDSSLEKARQRQQNLLKIWETSVTLLASYLEERVSELLENSGGTCTIKQYESPLELEDYLDFAAGRRVSPSWAFSVSLQIPGRDRLDKLVSIAPRSELLRNALGQGAPALLWSHPNPAGYPKWIADGPASPFAVEFTLQNGNGDEWVVRLPDDSVERLQSGELATNIANALLAQVHSR